MTLEELIRRFRTLAVDKVQPYLFDDEDVRRRLADNAARLLEDGRGALARTLALIEPTLPARIP